MQFLVENCYPHPETDRLPQRCDFKHPTLPKPIWVYWPPELATVNSDFHVGERVYLVCEDTCEEIWAESGKVYDGWPHYVCEHYGRIIE